MTDPGHEKLAEHYRKLREQRTEDIEADLALGIEPGRIAAGFGISPDSLARSLYRAGRKDLAARFRQRPWTDKNTRKAAA